MSILRKMLSSLFQPLAQETLPLIHQKAYTNDPRLLATLDPLISSEDFEDFSDMFGLQPFEHLLGYETSLEYPKPEDVEKSGTRNPLIFSVDVYQGGKMVKMALCGLRTELHAMIKQSADGDIYHIDHMHIRDSGRNKDIACGNDNGNLAYLTHLVSCFRETLGELNLDPCSKQKDLELALFKRMKPFMDEMDNAAYRSEPSVIITKNHALG